jgi:hypothetical protein
MLYTAPSGAVQIFFIWVGILGCYLFPKNRSAVVMLLVIVPLVGNILLLKLSLSSGWGMIVASWLVSFSSISKPLSPNCSSTWTSNIQLTD